MDAADHDPVAASAIDQLETDELRRHLKRDPRDIAFLLKQLLVKQRLVTGHFGGGDQCLVTTVIGVDPGHRHVDLEVSAEESITARVVAAASLLCVTDIDRVRLQFRLTGVARARLGGLDVLRAPLPDSLLYLQRRDDYRLSTPMNPPLTCQIPLPAFRSAVVAARVLDLSVGGLAIVAPSSRLNFEPGAEYRHCRLPLGDQGTLLVDLQVRYLFRVPSHGGVDVPRAGCQFIDLQPEAATALRRYMLSAPRLT